VSISLDRIVAFDAAVEGGQEPDQQAQAARLSEIQSISARVNLRYFCGLPCLARL
jgi:hypothetical protein